MTTDDTGPRWSADDHTALLATERARAILGEITRGIAHAMSNRVATISAGLFVLGEGDSISARKIQPLHAEVDLLEQLLVQLRQLPGEAGDLEPLLAGDIAASAIALHEHHGDLRSVRCEIDDTGSVPPARAVPQALLHALLIAITTAKVAAGAGRHAVLRLRSEEHMVRFVATVAGIHENIAHDDTRFLLEAAAANRLLGTSAGRAFAIASGCVVDVPTLASTRKQRS